MTNAVVFVLTRHLLPDAQQCISYCMLHGYHVIGVIKDDWKAAMALAVEGKAPVIVAACPEHVDPGREPRVEYVSHDRPRAAGGPREERTHIIRRTEAE